MHQHHRLLARQRHLQHLHRYCHPRYPALHDLVAPPSPISENRIDLRLRAGYLRLCHQRSQTDNVGEGKPSAGCARRHCHEHDVDHDRGQHRSRLCLSAYVQDAAAESVAEAVSQ